VCWLAKGKVNEGNGRPEAVNILKTVIICALLKILGYQVE
jgi:hypothetical protein